MDERIRDAIEIKLKKSGILISIDNIDEYILNNLIKIEAFKDSQKHGKYQLLKEYKKKKFSVKSVSENCSISRPTIYKYNEILGPYIESCDIELQQDDIFCKFDSLYVKIEEYEEIIQNYKVKVVRDEIRNQNDGKNNEYIKSLSDEIATLNRQIDSLEKENRRLRDIANDRKILKYPKTR